MGPEYRQIWIKYYYVYIRDCLCKNRIADTEWKCSHKIIRIDFKGLIIAWISTF